MKLYKEAERLYLKENLSVDEIAVQLDIARRTIFYWRKKYEWDKHLSQKVHKTDFNLVLTK
jgi:transposase-like protein